jgi:hypothetical protein
LSDSPAAAMVSTETQTEQRSIKAKFFVGDSTDEDSDAENTAAASEKAEVSSAETQTEDLDKIATNAEPRPPRPVQECSAILKSEVSAPSLITLR